MSTYSTYCKHLFEMSAQGWHSFQSMNPANPVKQPNNDAHWKTLKIHSCAFVFLSTSFSNIKSRDALHWSICSGMLIYSLIPLLIIWHFSQLNRFHLFKIANTCLNHLIRNHLQVLSGSYLSAQEQCSVNFCKQFKIAVSIAPFMSHQPCAKSGLISFIEISVSLAMPRYVTTAKFWISVCNATLICHLNATLSKLRSDKRLK